MSGDRVTVEYRQVPGFPVYRVGNDGSLWSRWAIGGRSQSKEWRQLADAKPGVRWYRKDHLREPGKPPRHVARHELVLEVFVGPCPPGMEACHANDETSNNRLDNLRWDTRRENSADRKRNGRQTLGEANGAAKLTREQVAEIRKLHREGESYSALARRFPVTFGHVGAIVRGESWGE